MPNRVKERGGSIAGDAVPAQPLQLSQLAHDSQLALDSQGAHHSSVPRLMATVVSDSTAAVSASASSGLCEFGGAVAEEAAEVAIAGARGHDGERGWVGISGRHSVKGALTTARVSSKP